MGDRVPAPRGRRVYRGDRRRPGRSGRAGAGPRRQPAARRRRGPRSPASPRPRSLDVAERRPACRGRPGRRARRRARAPRSPSAPVPQKRSSTRAPSTLAEHREDRLAHPVGGRPHRPAVRRRELPAAQLPADDPHLRHGLRLRGDLLGRSSPKRRRAASSSGPSSGASSEPWRSRSASTSLAGLEQERGVLGQLGDARSRGRPCWRVPRISPSPRSARSTSASLKPSRSPAIASSRAPRQLGPGVSEEDAVRLVLAATDPAAQLVELGEPEALGALDHHHGRVGDVDPDLDHGRRHQDVGLAGGEGLHRRAFCVRGHLAVEQADVESRAARSRASRFGLRLGRLGLCSFSDSLDQRADDVGLASLAQPLADELVGPGRALLPDHPGARPAGGRRAARAAPVVSRSP